MAKNKNALNSSHSRSLRTQNSIFLSRGSTLIVRSFRTAFYSIYSRLFHLNQINLTKRKKSRKVVSFSPELSASQPRADSLKIQTERSTCLCASIVIFSKSFVNRFSTKNNLFFIIFFQKFSRFTVGFPETINEITTAQQNVRYHRLFPEQLAFVD